jgi:Rad3-related DNA helicase
MASPFAIPFEPYPVQTAFHDVLLDNLRAGIHPVVALELPTGCGKTLSALSAVLAFQQEVRRMSVPERKIFFWQRSRHRAAIVDAAKSGGTCSASFPEEEGDEEETMDDLQQRFIQCFSNRGPGTGRAGKRRRRYDLPQGHLKQDHECPPLTIFYACRTHSQAQQAAAELKHFRAVPSRRKELQGKGHGQGMKESHYGIENLKMNIMASRERYCIHPTIAGKLRAHGGQGLESAGTNDLGEVCDKIVSYGQCEHWETFTQLADRALSGNLPSKNLLAGQGGTSKKQDNIWAIEDLVHAGEAFTGCPYYASREMVFHADITYLTYNYLLDPIIRSETKFESAIENNSIIIFDEAHNIPDVCQDVLSHNFRLESLQGFSSELGRLRGSGWRQIVDGPQASDPQPTPSDAAAAPVQNYPKQFRTKQWTLSQMFDFGYWLCIELQCFIEANCLQLLQPQQNQQPGDKSNGGVRTRLVTGLISNLIDKVTFKCLHCRNAANFLSLLKDFTAIIQTLGVTFNPFDLSIPTVGGLKKLLLLLQSLGQHPEGFGVWFEVSPVGDGENESGYSLQIRCLDSRLAFQHLLKKTFCCVLMSGTLAPFGELGTRLGFQVFDQPLKRRVSLHPVRKMKGKANVAPTDDSSEDQAKKSDTVELEVPRNIFSGRHVINTAEQCVIAALRRSNGIDFRCVRDAYASPQFMGALALAIWRLCSESCCVGGALIFLPNYSIAEDVFRRISVLSEAIKRSAIPCVLEPRGAIEFGSKFQWYKNRCVHVSRRRRTEIGETPKGAAAIFIGVHRGKLSEGLDFVDEMARLVISVGVPYRPLKDQGVICQRAYCGETWYLIDAVRSINQSLGRCIRHVNDFGAMIIIDSRFTEYSPDHAGENAGKKGVNHVAGSGARKDTSEPAAVNGYLSTWLKDSLVEFTELDELIQNVRECQERNGSRWQPKLIVEGESDHLECGTSPTDVGGASQHIFNREDSGLLRVTGLPTAATAEARLSLYGLSKSVEVKKEWTEVKTEPSSPTACDLKPGPVPLNRKPLNPFLKLGQKLDATLPPTFTTPTAPMNAPLAGSAATLPSTVTAVPGSGSIPERSTSSIEFIEIDD